VLLESCPTTLTSSKKCVKRLVSASTHGDELRDAFGVRSRPEEGDLEREATWVFFRVDCFRIGQGRAMTRGLGHG
jgi:hypothetical protein